MINDSARIDRTNTCSQESVRAEIAEVQLLEILGKIIDDFDGDLKLEDLQTSLKDIEQRWGRAKEKTAPDGSPGSFSERFGFRGATADRSIPTSHPKKLLYRGGRDSTSVPRWGPAAETKKPASQQTFLERGGRDSNPELQRRPDLDPQGHLAHLPQLPKTGGLKRWFYDEVLLSEVIVQARPNLFILPGDKSTEKVKGKIRDEPYGEQLFASQIVEQTKGFDLVILDLAPSLDVLHVAALMASQVLLVPTRLRFADLDGVSEILRSVQTVHRFGRSINPFILPTFFDRTTRETTLRLREVNDLFGGHLWPPVAQDIRVAEAPGYGKTIWEYAPGCQAAQGYENAAGRRVGGYCDTVNRLSTTFCLR